MSSRSAARPVPPASSTSPRQRASGQSLDAGATASAPAATPRVQPQGPLAARPPTDGVPRWRSRPSSDGRWIDAAAHGSPRPSPSRRSPGRSRRSSSGAAAAGRGPSWSPRPWSRVPRCVMTETTDTLRRGETISRPVRPPRRAIIDLSTLDSAAPPRSPATPIRPGVQLSARPSPTSMPSQIIVRTDPEQRITFRRVGRPVEHRASSRSSGEPRRCGSRAPSTTRSTRRSTPRSPTTSLDAGERATSRVGPGRRVTPGRSTSPGTSSRATASQVVFERLVSPEGEVRFGRVLASDLTMSGKSLTAFRFDAGGRAGILRRRRATRCGEPSSERQCSSAGSPPASRARASIPCSGSAGATRAPTTPPTPGTPVMAAGRWDRRACRLGRRLRKPGRAAAPERHHHALRSSPRLRPRGSGRAHGSRRARRSATSARPASPPARTCTTSSG